MLAIEDGPFDAFVRIRSRFDPLQTTWVGRGLNCPLCIGFWASWICLGVWYIPVVGQMLILWWAISGLQAAIYKVVG